MVAPDCGLNDYALLTDTDATISLGSVARSFCTSLGHVATCGLTKPSGGYFLGPVSAYLGDKADTVGATGIILHAYGATGPDHIDLVNGTRNDSAVCGGGLDTVYADKGDTVDPTCETVHRVA